MTAQIVTLRLRAAVDPSCLDVMTRLFKNPRHRGKRDPKVMHGAPMCVGLQGFLRRRKMPGGSAAKVRTEGHDAVAA